MAELLLRQVRSSIGCRAPQRDTLRALGLGGVGRQSSRPDTADMRAMVRAVRHLVQVESTHDAGGAP